ncbi:hypothetical protein [Tychonema sp. BBK16]|uniref:hypothetical protein n=1 Tax=Tychonema sp. BBK16 TaxID=2699888 RepID=UPI001F34A100|nr:hypothetical protein [Tychonema sp. BBK16]MCF6375099.1 hypothetical protein [Tychonema sp. BBK16]
MPAQRDRGELLAVTSSVQVGGVYRFKTIKERGKKEEGRRKKEEGRRKKEEGRGKREEGRGKSYALFDISGDSQRAFLVISIPAAPE